MKVPQSPTFTAKDLTSDAGVAKLNKILQDYNLIVNNLDFSNNFKGKQVSVVVQNGKPLNVNVQGSLTFVNFMKYVPNGGTMLNPTFTWVPSAGGLTVTVTWDGTATTVNLDVFVGVA